MMTKVAAFAMIILSGVNAYITVAGSPPETAMVQAADEGATE
jgi:hypothetical protein